MDNEGYKVISTVCHLQSGKSTQRFAQSNPYTIENIRLYISKYAKGYKLLSDTYKKSDSFLMFKCPDGHKFELGWGSFKVGRRCTECAGNKLKTQKEFKEQIKEFGNDEYILLSNYVNADTHVTLKHSKCGHVYDVTPSHFLDTSRRCPQCAIRYGEDNNLYNPNLTEEDRIRNRTRLGMAGISDWRKSVFEKDDYTCQICGLRGTYLNAHHKDGYHWCEERRFEVDNGVTLCIDCHRDFHKEYGRKNNTEKQFMSFLVNYNPERGVS